MDEFEIFYAQAQGSQSLPATPRIHGQYGEQDDVPPTYDRARVHGQTNGSDYPDLPSYEDVTEELLPRGLRDDIGGGGGGGGGGSRGVNGAGAKPKLTRMVSSPGMVTPSEMGRSNSTRRHKGENAADCNGTSGRRAQKRTYSMPVKRRPNQRPAAQQQLQPPEVAEGGEENYEVLRVRTFSTKSGGIINRGDSFKIKSRSKTGSFRRKMVSSREGSTDNQSLQSVDEAAAGADAKDLQVHIQEDGQNGQTVSTEVHYRPDSANSSPRPASVVDVNVPTVQITPASQRQSLRPGAADSPLDAAAAATQGSPVSDDDSDELVYTVLVLGSQGVGKTTLTEQLLTSEYLANSENLPDDNAEQKTVSVMLDDEESLVRFIDVDGDEPPKMEESVDAYIIIYSVTDRKSFNYAQACLHSIRSDKRSRHVVILVANKNDIVRNRTVSEEEGKRLATRHKCKCTEVSALLDHMVDELLVGITRQIRLAHQRAREAEEERAAVESFGCLQKAAWTVFRRLFKRQPAAKSCDNLFSP